MQAINNVPQLDLVANEWEDYSLTFWLFDNDLPIASMAETSPIPITCKYHGRTTGDKVIIGGVQCDDGRWSNANGIQTVTVVDGNNLTLNGTTTNGAMTKPGGIIATPRDCTGGGVECQLRQSPDDTAAITPGFTITTITIAEGNFKIDISASHLHDLVVAGKDDVFYDIFYIDSTGKRFREQAGSFTINKSISKG